MKILQFWLRRKFKSRTAILVSSKVGTKESEAEVCFFLKSLKLCLISTHRFACWRQPSCTISNERCMKFLEKTIFKVL